MIVTPDTKHILLYTGAWKGTNTVEVYSQSGELIYTTEPFSAGETSERKIVVLNIDAKESGVLVIKINLSNEWDDGSNVSLAALAVTGNSAGTAADAD